MRIGSCDKNPIVTRMMMNLDILFSLVGGRSIEAVVSGVLHIGADVVVPQAVSVCECSFSSPMRLRVSRQPSGCVTVRVRLLYRYGVVYRYTEHFPANPRLGFGISWAVYRYTNPCTGSLPTSRHSGDSHRDSYPPCGIGRRSGLPWARLIPRVGMMTTTGPLGSASARQPTGGSQGHRQPSVGLFKFDFEYSLWYVNFKTIKTYGGSGHAPGGFPLGPGA
uniref:Uncharacterized protein n=1 Tax=Ananas comosus var. bracteatus TaxID=296719 RepID=A0A6V7PLN1_ANACO|nr:unnamed protein product [Ananas comosus var. bracteatus]